MTTNSTTTNGTAKSAAAIFTSLVGLGLAAGQNTSVMEGTGKIWFGVAVAVAGVIIALLTGRMGALPVTVLLTVFAVMSAAYMQHEVDQKRTEIQQDLDGLSHWDTGAST
jgi:hypothetical protein